jgi:hypothetical protein
MNSQRSLLALLLVAFYFTATSIAQPSKPLSSRPANVPGNSNILADDSTGSAALVINASLFAVRSVTTPQGKYFEIQLRLHYYNRGNVPLIVPTTSGFFLVEREVSFLTMPSSDSAVSATEVAWRDPVKFQKMQQDRKYDLASCLKSAFLCSEFMVIPANGFRESGDLIRIKSGYTAQSRPNRFEGEAPVEIINPSESFFKVRYSIKIDAPELLAAAKVNWKVYGQLLTDAEGNIRVETEVITNRLID